ncbi:uncharacterized protein BCR38DRAFT_419147 [Pseudomassariella vexata]|uniref:Uncharacterized protein n=1 Tax=Pseudomassariella vexata TaxID=1141098 RepID=A0A1Y2ELM8_9PEZI|nr:uncharacterized protein BCR38DRAFT_419147 [Pseudomassariella vexata]ORY72176.1 hypothetical protein BCR38DRAFT_419147 [Pseudomassariella vexata]
MKLDSMNRHPFPHPATNATSCSKSRTRRYCVVQMCGPSDAAQAILDANTAKILGQLLWHLIR